MKYCDKCNVNIVGDRKCCPLCQGITIKINDDNSEVFPEIPTIYKQYNLFFRILIFISVVVAIVAVLVNYIVFPESGMWSMFVIAGIVCLWFNIAFAVRKRHNILKNIMYQVVTISLTFIFWDIITGWNKWSIDFAIPIMLSVSMIAMAIVANVMKKYVEDQIIYFCIDSLLGIIPLFFLITKNLKVIYPSFICVIICIITFVSLIVFQSDVLKNELKKRFHV